MINTKALQEKILDLAMRGLLVPQDLTDEPASILLKRIRREKEQLVKEKKIKKQKPLPEITKEEIPYALPERWEWVRLGEVGFITSGGTPKTKVIEYWDKGTIPWITPALMGKTKTRNFSINDTKYITQKGLENSSAQLIRKNSIVYSSRAPIGHINIVPFNYTTNQGCKSVTSIITNVYYLYYQLIWRTPNIINRGSGTTFKEISGSEFNLIPLSLPPLTEQQRIVEKIEELFILVDIIEENLADYEKLSEQLRQKTLDLAMRGLLVPQDPTDEPSSALLERIHHEKEQLVKEKKIKKQKPLPEITEEEIPYALPEGWEWVRLGEVSETISKGTTPPGGKFAYTQNGINYLRVENLKGYKMIKNNITLRIPIETHQGCLKRSILKENDILISIAGTLGKTALVTKSDLPLNMNQAIAFIRLIDIFLVNPEYLIAILNAPNMITYLIESKKTTSIPNLTLSLLQTLKIPLPPLKEQQRIVEKIEEIQKILKLNN